MSIQQLSKLAILKNTNDSVRQRLLNEGRFEILRAQERICTQGEAANRVFWVVEGRIKTLVDQQSASEAVMDLIETGGKIGLADVCLGETYSVSAVAVQASTVFSVDRDLWQSLLEEEFVLMQAVLGNLSFEMRGVVKEMNDLKLKNTVRRLGTFLLGMTSAHSGEATIDLPFDKGLLASRLGMKPESLSRALSKLKEHGVDNQRQKFLIEDVGVLREYCGDEDEDGTIA